MTDKTVYDSINSLTGATSSIINACKLLAEKQQHQMAFINELTELVATMNDRLIVLEKKGIPR